MASSPESRSKARKHGKYLHGRPWPRACPNCRSCGGGPPELFYNSRGLCNICHKDIRTGDAGALDAWEHVPSEANDASYNNLLKNPTRWLRKYMSGTYAAPFVEKGAEAVAAEAERIFTSIVDRWYGREASPSVVYADRTFDSWSSTDLVAEHTVTVIIPDHDDTSYACRPQGRERQLSAQTFLRNVGDPLLARVGAALRVVDIYAHDNHYAILWASARGEQLVISGATSTPIPATLELYTSDSYTAWPYSEHQLQHLVSCISS